jgi:hypothetical protein
MQHRARVHGVFVAAVASGLAGAGRGGGSLAWRPWARPWPVLPAGGWRGRWLRARQGGELVHGVLLRRRRAGGVRRLVHGFVGACAWRPDAWVLAAGVRRVLAHGSGGAWRRGDVVRCPGQAPGLVAAVHISGAAGGTIRAPDMACRAVATTPVRRGWRRVCGLGHGWRRQRRRAWGGGRCLGHLPKMAGAAWATRAWRAGGRLCSAGVDRSRRPGGCGRRCGPSAPSDVVVAVTIGVSARPRAERQNVADTPGQRCSTAWRNARSRRADSAGRVSSTVGRGGCTAAPTWRWSGNACSYAASCCECASATCLPPRPVIAWGAASASCRGRTGWWRRQRGWRHAGLRSGPS